MARSMRRLKPVTTQAAIQRLRCLFAVPPALGMTYIAVDTAGTRGNHRAGRCQRYPDFLYTQSEGYNPIVYKQSSLSPISFGAQKSLRAGSFNDASSTKQNYNNELVVIYSSSYAKSPVKSVHRTVVERRGPVDHQDGWA